jgi:hypothetical protein
MVIEARRGLRFQVWASVVRCNAALPSASRALNAADGHASLASATAELAAHVATRNRRATDGVIAGARRA